MKHLCVWLIVAALAAGTSACKKTPPANAAAMVNGHAITNDELEKTYKAQYPQQPARSNEDQMMTNRLETLNGMITNQIMLQQAEKQGLAATDSDVEAEFNKMKASYTKEEFDKRLAERHLTADDLRQQVRRDLTINKLINKEISSKISISDTDVSGFYNANKVSFNPPEAQVHMAQILVTPFPDPNVKNLKNSKAQNAAEAQAKIKDIAERLKKGEDFGMVAQNYSEDPNTAQNGGDMGFIPQSDLEKASPELRKLVDSLQPGSYSAPIATPDGFRILKIITREPAGQRDLNDPRVQQFIRETLVNRKDQLLKGAFYEVMRNGAKIENYLAQRIVASTGGSAK